MKYGVFIILFAMVGCGTEVPVDQTAQSLEEESYPYPEQSFDPDEGEWSSSEYGSGGGSGSGYGDNDKTSSVKLTNLPLVSQTFWLLGRVSKEK